MRARLPLTTRGSQFGVYLPDKEALLACFAVASSPEAADYMVAKFVERLKKTKMLEPTAEVLDKVKEYATNVHLQRDSRPDPWLGKTQIRTDFQNLQHNIAESAVSAVSGKVEGAVRMDIAISDEAQMLRGFSVDENPVAEDVVVALDKLFNSWLAENNMISQGSIIYEGSADGEILKDAAGNPIRAQEDKIRQLLNDKKNGFENYFAGFEKFVHQGADLTVQQHPYPEQSPQVEVQPAAEQPVTPSVEVGSEVTPAEEVAPAVRGGMAT